MMDVNRFLSEVKSCIEIEEELIKKLDDSADKFDRQQKRLDVAKLTNANTGLVGGILTIVGLSLAPFTFGASLGLTITGGILGGGSAVSSISTLIADIVISKRSENSAEAKLIEYSEKTVTIARLLPIMLKKLKWKEKIALQKKIENAKCLKEDTKVKVISWLDELHSGVDVVLSHGNCAKTAYTVFSSIDQVFESTIAVCNLLERAAEAGKVLEGMARAANMVVTTANGGRAVATAADVGSDAVAGTGKTAAAVTGKAAASSIKVAGIVTAGIGVAFDLGAIIYYSHKIHKRNPSKLAEKIRAVSECLKQETSYKKKVQRRHSV